VAEPTSVMVQTFGTGRVSDEKLEKLVRGHFDLRPYGIVKMLDLLHPIYRPTASYGHFGRDPFELVYHYSDTVNGKEIRKSHTALAFSWEMTDRAEALRKAAGM